MDPIHGLNQILEILRRQLSARSSRTPQAGPSAAPGTTKRSPSRISTEEMRRRLSERIAALDPADQKAKKGAQVFVESILAWQFGEELLHDPEFPDMSREIQNAMTSDPAVWRRFQALLGELAQGRKVEPG